MVEEESASGVWGRYKKPAPCHCGNQGAGWFGYFIRRALSASVTMNQVEQFVDGFGFGNILFDALLAAVETDFAACRTYVAVVGVGHFARAVDDAYFQELSFS